jgi:hypothetical protein
MTLEEIYNSQSNKEESPKSSNELIIRVPEIEKLIKHLDALYIKMLAQSNEESSESSESIGWFNNGQGSKSQADSVN